MKAYIITLSGNQISEEAAQRCKKSSNIDIETFDAVTASEAKTELALNQIEWTYPWHTVENDFKSGLRLHPYNTVDDNKRIACFMSHYKLWEKAVVEGPLLVLEHDAIFVEKLNYQYLLDSGFDIISINDPRGATRKAQDYHDKVQKCEHPISPVPSIDDVMVPQGLPGNSAYIIKPAGAQRLIDTVNEYGAWPNDAIMCKQLVARMGVSKTYYTKVQGTPSTTSL